MTAARVRAMWASLSLVAAAPLAAQDLKAGLMGSPAPGREAPGIVLPYFTAAGPGPANQPFRLSAELGRVVVLVFDAREDNASAAKWAEVTARLDSLAGSTVALVGVVHAGAGPTQVLATGQAGQLKFLADSLGLVHRRYGVGRGARHWLLVVVADDGRVVSAGPIQFGSSAWWGTIGPSVRRGRTAVPRS